MIRTRTAVVAALVVSALALGGCAAGSPDDSGDGGGGTLTIGASVAPNTLDPAGSEWGNRAPFYQAVYDTLLRATTDGTVEPFLAESFEYDESGTELTLTLRDDVTFTDGSDLTAEVVVANLQRFQSGTSPNANNLAGISFAAPDERTVVLTLDDRNPALLNYLTRDAGLIASGDALGDTATLATDPVGSGPYVLDTAATVTGTTYAYTANPDYWNPELQHYEDLVITVFTDPTAALNAIKAGEVNAVKLVNNDSLAEVEGAGWTLQYNELDFQGLLLLDRAGTMNEALGDVRVRQAINHAFDREALLQALQGGNGTVTEQVFPESSDGFDAALDERYPYDPEAARELLADAGYPDGFTLTMPTTPAFAPTLFTLITQQLGDIGITVETSDSGNNFIADILAPRYPATYMSLEQNSDWQLIQFMLAPTATWNPFDYADPEVDALIEQIHNADADAAGELVAELNTYIVEQAWFAPFYRKHINTATDPNTSVTLMPTNAYPAIYDFVPKG